MALTVYYWGPLKMNMYGRAIGIYATLYQAGAEFEMKTPDEMPENGAFAVPCLDIDGLVVGQTAAVLMVLGKRFELAGSSPAETVKIHQAVLDFDDIFSEHGKFEEKPDRAKKWFSYLDAKIAAGGTTWVAGTKEATVADFHGVFACEWLVKKGIDFTSDYPNIAKWWEAVKTVPGMKKLYDSCVDGRTMIP
jgi:glutathione S-transferase